MELYKYPIGLTQQFRHCGNPFRIDSYKGCGFGCKYCFANTENFQSKNNFQLADIEVIKRYFKKAFDEDKENKNITVELLRHKVPLHLGGMSDPFQPAENDFGITYQILEICKKYNYPIIISTKTDNINRKYFELIDKERVAFQCSLISINEKFIRNFEKRTALPTSRIKFIKNLKDRDIWVSIRIQPLISLNEAKQVVNTLSGIVNYITVEHLKIATNDKIFREMFFTCSDYNIQDYVCTGKNYELKQDIKENNIKELQYISKCPIGVGDNDLHYLSQSLNCCGVDTMPNAFQNYLKYNSMYIGITNDNTQWFPKCNCSSCFNSDCRKQGFTFKDYVDDFIQNPKKNKNINIKI